MQESGTISRYVMGEREVVQRRIHFTQTRHFLFDFSVENAIKEAIDAHFIDSCCMFSDDFPGWLNLRVGE